jgi:hypothetical protein
MLCEAEGSMCDSGSVVVDALQIGGGLRRAKRQRVRNGAMQGCASLAVVLTGAEVWSPLITGNRNL